MTELSFKAKFIVWTGRIGMTSLNPIKTTASRTAWFTTFAPLQCVSNPKVLTLSLRMVSRSHLRDFTCWVWRIYQAFKLLSCEVALYDMNPIRIGYDQRTIDWNLVPTSHGF